MLSTQLKLPARESELVEWRSTVHGEQCLIGSVKLTGSRVSGDVHLLLPDGFVTKLAGLLLGRSAVNTEEAADITGELCNMLAGRVAADLTAAGYSSTLSTPEVSHGRGPDPEIALEAQTCRSDWTCEGHLFTLILQIIFRCR